MVMFFRLCRVGRNFVVRTKAKSVRSFSKTGLRRASLLSYRVKHIHNSIRTVRHNNNASLNAAFVINQRKYSKPKPSQNSSYARQTRMQGLGVAVPFQSNVYAFQKRACSNKNGGTPTPPPAPESGGGGSTGIIAAIGVGLLGFGLYKWNQGGNGSGSSSGKSGKSEVGNFPTTWCPDKMPDLSEHANFMAESLKANPQIYYNCKDLVTKSGVTFAKCIKTGMDNKAHPMIKTVGMVAGDEESYELFKELFDPVIDGRHGGYGVDRIHPTDLDTSKLSSTVIDPTGNYVISTRVRTGRSIRGFRLAPSLSKAERREIEKIITNAGTNGKAMTGDWKSEYYPLSGSTSYNKKPKGMDNKTEELFRERHWLFQEPDSTLLISSEMERHWPDGRGIMVNKKENFLVWVNEEDHMRIISMEKGSDIKGIFTRFANGIGKVEQGIKAQGYEFMHNAHLGYILTCPSNLGTGLRASVLVKIPLFSKRKDFKQICRKMRLGVRGFSGVDSASVGGIYDLSNFQRLGYSEVDLVNVMIDGCAQIVRWEQMLERGESIDAELPK